MIAGLGEMALRNVVRHRGRSAASLLALGVGVAAMLFGQGFVDGMLRAVIEDAVGSRIGAIQLHRAGHLDAERDALTLDLPAEPAFEARLRSVAGVRAVAGRIAFEGTLSDGRIAAGFAATAIDPEREYQVCPKRRLRVAPGSAPLTDGSDGAIGVLLGGALAEGLGAAHGTTLIATAPTQAGPPNALALRVDGTLPEGNVTENKATALVPLPLAQSLLRMPGRVTEYVVGVGDLDTVEDTAAALRAALGPDIEVTTWRQWPAIRNISRSMGALRALTGLILALLVMSAVGNTLRMSVEERVREIGTLLALGVRRRQVMALFVVEAALLGAAGALGGAALGTALLGLTAGGLAMPATTLAGALVIVPRVGPGFVAAAVVAAVLVAVLAALAPAWRASRLRPVEALRAS